MYKKIAVALCLLALVALAPAPDVFAKPKATVRLENIVYANFRPAPDGFTNKEGLAFLADGLGTINCNGVAACIEVGLDAGTVRVQQAIYWETDRPTTTNSQARTAGTLQLGAYAARTFKGKGYGTTACSAGDCLTALVLDANLEGGAKIIARIDIDHTSAGVIASMQGEMDLLPR